MVEGVGELYLKVFVAQVREGFGSKRAEGGLHVGLVGGAADVVVGVEAHYGRAAETIVESMGGNCGEERCCQVFRQHRMKPKHSIRDWGKKSFEGVSSLI